MAYYKEGEKDLAKVVLTQALKLRQTFPGAQEARDTLATLE